MPPKAKGGVRQRLGLYDSSAEPVEVAEPMASMASSSGLRGGVRSRVGEGNEDGGVSYKKRKCKGPLIGTLNKTMG